LRATSPEKAIQQSGEGGQYRHGEQDNGVPSRADAFKLDCSPPKITPAFPSLCEIGQQDTDEERASTA
jgi:hypothetical protein